MSISEVRLSVACQVLMHYHRVTRYLTTPNRHLWPKAMAKASTASVTSPMKREKAASEPIPSPLGSRTMQRRFQNMQPCCCSSPAFT